MATMTDRAGAMARRLDGAARRLGIPDEGCTLIRTAFEAAMEPRRQRVPDDHHPDYLHPARTALILMDDARVADAAVLAMALFAETRDPSLAAPTGTIQQVDPVVAEAVAGIPIPAREAERLVESLLALSPDQALVAVAERIDHARHLHLRDRDEWAVYHGTTCAAYAPVAGRVHPALGGRLDWWCSTFKRRFLQD